MDADPVDTTYTRDCMALVRAKVINGMSMGFNVIKDAWYDDEGNPSDRFNGTRRELIEGQLVEGSPVTRPAYGGTAISARDESNALLEARQRAADAAAEERETAPEEPEGPEIIYVFEDRASSVSAADRKALAAKGQALSDGSYPIPDKSH